jgi:hypothetical protein
MADDELLGIFTAVCPDTARSTGSMDLEIGEILDSFCVLDIDGGIS